MSVFQEDIRLGATALPRDFPMRLKLPAGVAFEEPKTRANPNSTVARCSDTRHSLAELKEGLKSALAEQPGLPVLGEPKTPIAIDCQRAQ
jgi:hypothetical protein